jgi:DNA invertase Pin-like site-specific DNA recombinase
MLPLNAGESGFFHMRKAIFAGEIKTVIVWKLDRLSRKMLDGIATMRFWLNMGVRIISVTQDKARHNILYTRAE